MKHFLLLLILAIAWPAHAQSAKKKTEGTSTKKTGTSSSSESSAKKTPSESTAKIDSDTAKGESEKIKEGPATDGPPVAAVSSIDAEDIQGFEHYAPQIQELIRKCLDLTKRNLTYSFGSADPKNGGMDCSGTIYFVLHDFGFKGVPRQSNEMAGWVKDKTLLYRVNDADSLSHAEFGSLQPGNLLFWSGTYDAGPREIPVTHVMLYLGKLKSSGKHIVFGASDGRAYQGKRRSGVSVFDFSLPKSTSSASFYGYGMIPGVGKIEAKPQLAQPPVVAALTSTPKLEVMPEPKVVPEKKVAVEIPKKKVTGPITVVEAPKPEPTPAKVTTESKETKPAFVPQVVVAAPPQEEVRPALRVNDKAATESNVTKTEKTQGTVSESDKDKASSDQSITASARKRTAIKSASSNEVASANKSTTAKPKVSTSTQSQSTKPKTVARRKAAPPPTPMDKAKRVASSFVNNVRRTFE